MKQILSLPIIIQLPLNESLMITDGQEITLAITIIDISFDQVSLKVSLPPLTMKKGYTISSQPQQPSKLNEPIIRLPFSSPLRLEAIADLLTLGWREFCGSRLAALLAA